MTAAEKVAYLMHQHAKYVGFGRCGSPTCVECAR